MHIKTNYANNPLYLSVLDLKRSKSGRHSYNLSLTLEEQIGTEYSFVAKGEEVLLDIDLLWLKDMAVMTGDARANFTTFCSRCDKAVTKPRTVQITAQIGEVDEYEDELDAQVGFYYLRDYEYIDLVEILRDEFFEVGEFNPICGDTCAPKTPQHITITSENKHELNTAEEKVASSPFAALQSLMNK